VKKKKTTFIALSETDLINVDEVVQKNNKIISVIIRATIRKKKGERYF
jgi:hypothetical protein